MQRRLDEHVDDDLLLLLQQDVLVNHNCPLLLEFRPFAELFDVLLSSNSLLHHGIFLFVFMVGVLKQRSPKQIDFLYKRLFTLRELIGLNEIIISYFAFLLAEVHVKRERRLFIFVRASFVLLLQLSTRLIIANVTLLTFVSFISVLPLKIRILYNQVVFDLLHVHALLVRNKFGP